MLVFYLAILHRFVATRILFCCCLLRLQHFFVYFIAVIAIATFFWSSTVLLELWSVGTCSFQNVSIQVCIRLFECYRYILSFIYRGEWLKIFQGNSIGVWECFLAGAEV